MEHKQKKVANPQEIPNQEKPTKSLLWQEIRRGWEWVIVDIEKRNWTEGKWLTFNDKHF